MVNVEPAELLLVNAHEMINLRFDESLLNVVPREGSKVVVADVQRLKFIH